MIKEKKQTEELLTQLNHLAKYWAETENTTEDKLSGVLFSFLVMIDGGATTANGFFEHGIKMIDNATGEEISNGYLHEIFNNYKK